MAGEKVTISSVARAAGVSVATVSRVIHNAENVTPENRDRVNSAIAAMNYIPNRSAQVLKAGRSNTILHVVPDIMNSYYTTLYRRIRSKAAELGYQVVLYDTEENAKQELQAISYFQENRFDGMVFSTIDQSEEVLNALCMARRPIVLTCESPLDQIDAYYASPGFGIYGMTKYILGLGHRRVAYAGGKPDSVVNVRRREGYFRALREAGVTANRDLVFEMDFNIDGGYRAGMYFAAIPNPPTAICAANDLIAIGIMQALHEKGIRIPEDISVSGEDNIAFSRMCRPQLTTVSHFSDEVVDHILDMLLDRVEGRYSGPARQIGYQERTMFVRSSTGAPRVGASVGEGPSASSAAGQYDCEGRCE